MTDPVTFRAQFPVLDHTSYLNAGTEGPVPARAADTVHRRIDLETGAATVIVNDYQLSLAIGKEGQNARLAARLTGWRVDIKGEADGEVASDEVEIGVKAEAAVVESGPAGE